ncbi:MAG: Gfo/Idh/MocA family oxidoreductase [Vibrio sp.]
MKLGLIGFGKSAHRYHLPFIDNAMDNGESCFEVIGYYTRGSRQFDMPYPNLPSDLTRFEQLDDLLASEADVIVITTPASTHFEFAKAAIAAKKHVVVEKPFCDTLDQAKTLYALAQEAGVKITPYQNRRFDSDFLMLKHVLERDDIGEVMEIESNHTHYRTDGVSHQGNQYDGSVYGHAVHFLDQIVSLYGEPDDMVFDLANQKNAFLGTGQEMGFDPQTGLGFPEDHYDIKLIYGKLRVRVRFSQLVVKAPPRWIINSTQATFEKYDIDQQERDLKQGIFLDSPTFGHDLESGRGMLYFQDKSEQIPAIYQHYTGFYQAVYQAIKHDKPMPVSQQQALTVMKLMENIVTTKPSN